MQPKIQSVVEYVSLGEGPHWDADNQILYYVDIFGKNLLKYQPSTNKRWKVSVAPRQASIIIPVQGRKDQFLVSFKNELVLISWDGGDKISILETLYEGGNFPDTKNHTFNDGKCDSSGRIWIGTYETGSTGVNLNPTAFLYSFDSSRTLKGHVDKVQASNGMAFNEKAKKFYYIDSAKRTVDQFDFDVVKGSISNRQVLFTLETNNVSGLADGMTIDTDGNLWVAIFNGGKVIKIDGSKPETLLETIEMPALQVTSVAFGGPNLDELYVTSGSFEFEGQKAPPPPVNGATYKVTGLGVKGYPGVGFKLD